MAYNKCSCFKNINNSVCIFCEYIQIQKGDCAAKLNYMKAFPGVKIRQALLV